jgi:hypothetical protein
MSIGQDSPQAPDVEKKSKSGTVDSFHQSEGRRERQEGRCHSDSRASKKGRGNKKEEERGNTQPALLATHILCLIRWIDWFGNVEIYCFCAIR